MWIPSNLTATVCFLCVERRGKTLYGGTAFFVSKEEAECPELKWAYLVTAKHCVEKAFDKYGNLSCRLNTKNGSVKFIPLPRSKWIMSDLADVAILPFDNDDDAELLLLPEQMFVTDELIEKEGIGLGDEIFLLGLFREVYGKKRNFPIIRGGMIASMLDEPLQDKDTGNCPASVGTGESVRPLR